MTTYRKNLVFGDPAFSKSTRKKIATQNGFCSEKKLTAELSKQAIASSINKAETIDAGILRIAARGLQLVEEKLNNDGVAFANRVKAPLRKRHRGSKAHSGSHSTFRYICGQNYR